MVTGDDGVPGSSLVEEGVPLVMDLGRQVGEARRTYRDLSALVSQFPGLADEDVAVRLNLSLRHASLIRNGASFEEFVAGA